MLLILLLWIGGWAGLGWTGLNRTDLPADRVLQRALPSLIHPLIENGKHGAFVCVLSAHDIVHGNQGRSQAGKEMSALIEMVVVMMGMLTLLLTLLLTAFAFSPQTRTVVARSSRLQVYAREALWAPGGEAPAHLDGSLPGGYLESEDARTNMHIYIYIDR